MGLSTHVLDAMHGTPAAGMAVALYETHGEQATLVKRFTLNADGRNPDGPLFDNASLKVGEAINRATRETSSGVGEGRISVKRDGARAK